MRTFPLPAVIGILIAVSTGCSQQPRTTAGGAGEIHGTIQGASERMTKAVGRAAITADELRCEYCENPSGVDIVSPRLTWFVKAQDPARRGLRQTAYQVLAASTAGLLAKNKGDLWDSGKVESDESLQATFGGSPLQSRQRCYWKVRLWDQDGHVSAWSRPAVWTMGLLKPDDWKARWIQAEATDGLPIFRKGFVVGERVQRAELYICGLGAFEARLDGEMLGEDILEPGWTNYGKTCLYRVFDLTSQLRPGRHALAVCLGNGMYNVTKGRYTKFMGSFGPPKLIAQLILDYADGSSEYMVSDASWKTTRGPITFSSIYGGEDYDARLELPGWDQAGFDDAAWARAVGNRWTRRYALRSEPLGATGASSEGSGAAEDHKSSTRRMGLRLGAELLTHTASDGEGAGGHAGADYAGGTAESERDGFATIIGRAGVHDLYPQGRRR